MKRLFLYSGLCLLLFACSTTRVLEEGQYQLEGNNVVITDDNGFSTGEISNYIRQDDGDGGLLGFNPFVYVYNWSKKDGLWHKIGTPPIVYDEASVGTSINNISNRLRYLGYYDSKVDSTTIRNGKKIKVNYIVTLGKRLPIEKIEYEVPDYMPFAGDFYADTLRRLAAYGAKIVRLDAFAYAPKEVGARNFLNEPGTWDLLRGGYRRGPHPAQIPHQGIRAQPDTRCRQAPEPLYHREGDHIPAQGPQVQGVRTHRPEYGQARAALPRKHSFDHIRKAFLP